MRTLLLSPEIKLSKGGWQLTLSPSAGGRITSLSSSHAGQMIDWIVPMPEQCRQQGFPASAWPKAGIYPLLPFSNRIRNGKISWEGLELSLPLHQGERHAMHGFGHTAEWELLDCDGNSAEMLYSHAPGDSGWPWAFQAKQKIVLDAGSLSMKLELGNLSHDALPPMPLGAGFHPYFPRRFAQHVAFDAQQLWRADAEHVATGVAEVPARHDYRSARAIASDEELTLYYGGWKRQAGMADIHGNRIAISASPLLSHLVLHAPAARDYLCVEPVTHVTDAINLAQAGFSGTGLQRLPCGHTFSCDIRLDFFDVTAVTKSP
ncbi:aldose epimerase family protein [Collimonas silvisoli]|uniref:aldose epimerase family protein n=1 Tax=Collimonas silvisoli TaxID=2825884 RepID=UPI001B8C2E03|nr:aldose 1-epimerase [Collimonas silvisoli]